MPEKGLAEVVAAQTALSDIDGKMGLLSYCGYDIHDLAQNATFEEVVYLLQNQRLPNPSELEDLNEQIVTERELSGFLRDLMGTLAQQTSPMSMLRTSISAASARSCRGPPGGSWRGPASGSTGTSRRRGPT